MRAGMLPGDEVAPRVFLDACVLYPPLVRRLLLGAAAAGFFTPAWSARVLAEWRIAIAAKQGLTAEDAAIEAQAAMRARFPKAEIGAEAFSEADFLLPDPADAHVLAAAVASGAGVLVTFNLRDFPRRALAVHGIELRHPDGFLWELWSHDPARMAPVIEAALATGGAGADQARTLLKRAKLPRFGKAVGEEAATR